MPEQFKFETVEEELPPIPEGEEDRLKIEIRKLNQIQEAEAAKFGKKAGKKAKLGVMEQMELRETKELRKIEVESDGEGKFHFVWKDHDGYPKNLTRGDLISDMEWGIYYDLNHLDLAGRNLRESYEDFRKKYITHFYQRKIDRFTNMEIAARFTKSEQDPQIANAYKATYHRLKDEKEGESGPAGFLFETMLKCILQKVSEDFGHRHDFKFVLGRGNVMADIKYKSDIVIEFIQGNRGVNVNESKEVKGFQVTLIERNDPKFRKKLQQIERANQRLREDKASGENTIVDEVVDFKVEVGNQEVLDNFNNWAKRKRPGGGPELFFSADRIMEFLTDIFQKSDLDLNIKSQIRETLQNYFKEKK